MKKQDRRNFIKAGGSLIISIPVFNFLNFNLIQNDRNRILLRTGWGTENYGELASIPAVYKAIQRYVPNTEVYIWPDQINEALKTLLENSFTQLNLVQGEINEEGKLSTDELKEAFDTADLFLYVSGNGRKIDWSGNEPAAIETRSLSYCQKINLPFVVYGLGKIPETPDLQASFTSILNASALSVLTDTRTGNKIKELKLNIDNLKYGPDPLFAFDLKNESGARQLLADKALSEREFIAVIINEPENSGLGEKNPLYKITYLVENWVQLKNHHILMIPDSKNNLNLLNKIYDDFSDEVKKKTIIFDGDFSPDLISSIMQKARIVTALTPYPLFSAIQSDVPILHYADLYFTPESQVFIDLGLKNYVVEIDKIPEQELLKKLTAINDSYVNALLEINKSNKEVMKQMEKSFGEIHQILLKINPAPKKKKQKKSKE